MLLALVAAGLANVMQGVERFVGAAVATAASSTVFLVFAAVLLANGRGLVALGQAAVAQYVVGVVLRVWMLRDLLAVAPFGRMPGDHARALLSFAARMQINVASTLINSQTDKVVVGLVSSTRAVGQVGIGSQVAEALRFVCFAALGPLLARMAIVQGEGGGARLIVFYQQVSGCGCRGSRDLRQLLARPCSRSSRRGLVPATAQLHYTAVCSPWHTASTCSPDQRSLTYGRSGDRGLRLKYSRTHPRRQDLPSACVGKRGGG